MKYEHIKPIRKDGDTQFDGAIVLDYETHLAFIGEIERGRRRFEKLTPFTARGNKKKRATRPPTRHQRQIVQCRSVLGLACCLLPSDMREDALDEWLDELHCAAAEKRPVVRRTISIAVGAVLRLSVEARRSVRVHIKGD